MIVYEQGRAAYIDDFRIDDNPYDRESDYDSWCDWHYGWINAKDKKMTERKYNKGDKVTFEGTVIKHNMYNVLEVDVNGSHVVYIAENKILSHTPAPIKVGDKVRIFSSEYTNEVLAILDYRYVWLASNVSGEPPFTVDIRNVKRA